MKAITKLNPPLSMSSLKVPHAIVISACALALGTSALAQNKNQNSDAASFYQGFLLSSNITGSHVKNLQNEDLGTIDNLIVNPETGRLRFAVLSVGGFLGAGETNVVVPWGALNVEKPASGASPSYVLDTTRDKLKNAPKFDPSKLADLYNRTTAEPIFTYYDIIWFPDIVTPQEKSAKSSAAKPRPSPSATASTSP